MSQSPVQLAPLLEMTEGELLKRRASGHGLLLAKEEDVMKNTKLLKMLLLSLCSAAAFVLASCEEKGPAEKAGEKVDEAIEEVEDEVDDATTN